MFSRIPSVFLMKFIRNNRTPCCSLKLSSHFKMLEGSQTVLSDKVSPDQVALDLRRTESVWRNRKDSDYFHRQLAMRFAQQDSVSSYAISLIRLACENSSVSLVSSLIVGFDKYMASNKIDFKLSLAEKIDVMNSCLNLRNFELVQLTCHVFQIYSDVAHFKDFIDDLVKQGKLLSAALCMGALNLTEEYPIEKIILPLTFSGKLHSMLFCLQNYPETQLELAQKLDSMLDMKEAAIQKHHPLLSRRKLFKMLSTVINAFKIPTEKCKNLHHFRRKSALHFLLKRRAQHSLTDEGWAELTKEAVGDNMDLLMYVISRLKASNDFEAASKLTQKMNLKDFNLQEVFSTFAEIDSKKSSEIAEDNNMEDIVPVDNLVLELDSSAVLFISSPEDLMACVEDITQNYELLGVDCEWKANFGLSSDRLSLIQLAVRDKVYILDMLSLAETLCDKDWDRFMDGIFGNSKLIKLGCGIMSDVQMIVDLHRGRLGKTIRFSHILDMAVFYQKLEEVYPKEMNCDDASKSNQKGLSKLCELILGKSLNKEERLCDWEKRPLKQSQLEYAALDAHCLLQVYDKLKQDSVEKDINFDHLMKVSIVMTSRLYKPKRQMKGVSKDSTIQVQTPIPIQEFKVMVDSNLERQGKQLRQFGADVLILNSHDTLYHALRLSMLEKRTFICSDEYWKKLQNGYSESWDLSEIHHCDIETVVPELIQKFNVQLKMKNMLSRCRSCNNLNAIFISAKNLNVMNDHLNSGDELKNDDLLDSSLPSEDFSVILDSLIKNKIKLKFDSHYTSNENSIRTLCIKCGTVQ